MRLIKEFAPGFATPLTHVFNCCLSEGSFPNVWKSATITPIPKVGNITSFDQLRHISLTPIFARIFETFIAKWILNDISDKIDLKQYGNITGSSTVHYLVDMLNYFHEGLDKPSQYAYLSTIDFTKAFDRVNHNVVIKKYN